MTNLEKIDLQWFGDADPGVPEIEFEVEGDGVSVEEPEEDPNAPKPKTPEEYEAEIAGLKGQADSNTALREAVEGLGSKIGGGGSPAPPAAAQPVVIDDTGIKDQFNTNIFGENPYGVVKNLVEETAKKIAQDITKKQVGQVAGAFAGSMVKTQKALLKNDPVNGALYTEYENEVEGKVQELIAQNPASASHPDLYQHAFTQVKLANIDAISTKLAEKIMADKAGVTKPPVQHSERSGGAGAPKTTSKKVTVTKREERLCDLRGLPLEAFARMKAEDGASFNDGGEIVYGQK